MNRIMILPFIGVVGALIVYSAAEESTGETDSKLLYQCLELSDNPTCNPCQDFNRDNMTEIRSCAADASAYETHRECQIETGCGPYKWQCSKYAQKEGKCTPCATNSTTENDKEQCEQGATHYMTKEECEVKSDKCGHTCANNQVDSECATCELSCDEPVAIGCSPFTCGRGCRCKPGLFRASKVNKCIRPEQCKRLPETKPCFQKTLDLYKENYDKINKTSWPHQQSFGVPHCDISGKFDEIQCSDTTNECHCVDPETGVEIPETKLHIDKGLPDCGGGTDVFSPSPPPQPPTPACPKNEYFEGCPSFSCGRLCSNPGQKYCIEDCVARCECKWGYFRNNLGVCIPGSQCPPAKTECHRRVFEFMQPTDTDYISGIYVPECDENGNFLALQCDDSIGKCWCVDQQSGNEIASTRFNASSFGDIELPCGEKSIVEPPKCRNKAIRSLSGDEYVPVCESDGSYKRTQCDKKSGGNCWCVDPNSGEEVKNTRRPMTDKPLDCATFSLSTDEVSRSKPTCGKREEKDEKSDLALCEAHCLNPNPTPETCREYQNPPCVCKRGYFRSEKGDCVLAEKCPQDNITECHRRVFDAAKIDSPKLLGAKAVPRCDIWGNFEKYVCHPSTGYCWCVDELTGEEIQGTRKGPAEPRNPDDCNKQSDNDAIGDNNKKPKRVDRPQLGMSKKV